MQTTVVVLSPPDPSPPPSSSPSRARRTSSPPAMSAAASTIAPTRFAHTGGSVEAGCVHAVSPCYKDAVAAYPTAPIPRVAVFDLDGTLLDSSYAVSPRTSAALKAIADAGVLIVLTTGRPLDAVLGQVDGHHAHFVVGSNGRELYSFETDHRVHERFPIDLHSAGVDKLAGVRRLTVQLGVRRLDVIAFGDDLDDHGVLSWAGRGIAMGNADPETIAIADEVTLTNDEDGVAVVLEALLREAG